MLRQRRQQYYYFFFNSRTNIQKDCYFKMELSEVVDGHCGESYLIMRKPLLINHKEAETIKEVLYASNKY